MLQSMGSQSVGHEWATELNWTEPNWRQVSNVSPLPCLLNLLLAYLDWFVSVFSLSVTSDSLQPHGLQHTRPSCPAPTSAVYNKLMSFESVMPSNHLILCRSLLLPPSVFPSIRVFSKESVLLIRWPKFWSFSFSISPSNESSGLISFRMDWFDLLAVQGTLESLFQHLNSKASILQYSTFFIVQSHICTWLLEKP